MDYSRWHEVSRVRNAKTHVVPAFWEDLPKLEPGAKVTVLEADGPGVVSQIHLSALGTNFGVGFDSPETQSVILRVFYDRHPAPAIEMPLMDFCADVQCRSDCFNTIYFTKVRESHNVHLPMPFRRHIRIEVENPSASLLYGYMDVQWEEVPSIPADSGLLRVDYRRGEIDARKDHVLFEAGGAASIVAHWLQYESPRSPGGEVICEANQEIYLDGDARPTLNYLGTEDVYGYSWGYKQTHSDGYAAILKKEDLNPGSRIAVLRCRANDAISFRKSCRWVLTFAHDPWARDTLGDTPVPFRHCVYYYSNDLP